MKAYFELDDKGTCNSFTMVKGVTRNHQFIKDAKTGSSLLRFDGPRANFDALMKDIYGVTQQAFRTKAIWVFPEIPDAEALEAVALDQGKKINDLVAKLQVLENFNAELQQHADGLEAKVQNLVTERLYGKPSAFPPANFTPPASSDDAASPPKLAAGSASLEPDTAPPAANVVLTPQQKRKATRAAKKAGIAVPTRKRNRKKAHATVPA